LNERPENDQSNDALQQLDALDHLIESELSRSIDAPDMTKAIMGRLGYMRLSESAVRQRARMKWVRRLATAACLGLVLGVGLLMHMQSADSRLPVGPTIPAAMHESIRQSGEQFDRAIDTIRKLDVLPGGGGAKPDLDSVPVAPDMPRLHRPELQRENQPPFRWV